MENEEDLMLLFRPDAYESQFGYWSELPLQLKITILEYLPYPTLRSFMFLSKECLTLASKLKTEACALMLQHSSFQAVLKKNALDVVVYYIPPDATSIPNSHRPYRLTFVEDEEGGCVVKRVRGKKGKFTRDGVRYNNETHSSAAIRTFIQLSKGLKAEQLSVEVDAMDPGLERTLKEQSAGPTISCKSFLIRTLERALPPLLLPHLAPGCKLQVYNYPIQEPGDIFINTAFFDTDVMRAAPSFDTETYTGITDEQIALLQARRLYMRAPYVSSCGINKLLLQWLESKRIISGIGLIETKALNRDQVLEGVDPSKILPWPDGPARK
ncbi:hypothetical protein Aduo_000840 [Ancylostoma duodenale]